MAINKGATRTLGDENRSMDAADRSKKASINNLL